MKTDARGPRITARSFFQQLRSYGYDSTQLIHVVSELIELITHSVREERCLPESSQAANDNTQVLADTASSSQEV